MNAAKATILLADDSAHDAELVRHAFRHTGYENRIEWVCRGEDAVSYLKGGGEFADREKFPLPELMLLD
jgi:two-component system response regulator